MKGKRTCSRRSIIAICCGAVIVIGLAIGLGLGLGTKDNSSNEQSETLTPIPPSTGNGTTPNSNVTWWTPKAKTTWQIILNETVGVTNFDNMSVYDIDLFDNSVQTINSLHAAGKKVICYFSAGSYENWRPDANKFPDSVLGNDVSGWPGERWLNTNSAVVRNVMIQRIELAKNKSCDGLDPDNIDAYNNDNGLGLTQRDAINYVEFLANEGHSRGMAVGLKNGGDIVTNVTNSVDWEVNEECLVYDECSLYEPFISADKPVFHIEYSNNSELTYLLTVCQNSPTDFSTLVKRLPLDEWYEQC
jgi:hypothetical protein